MKTTKISTILATLTLGTALVACSGEASESGEAAGESVSVFAASSTRVLNEDFQAQASQLDPALDLSFSNDGSGSLVTQLNEGAPADVLITADQKSMDQAVADGTVNDPELFASNSMVMVVPAGNPAGITSVEDLDGNQDITLVLCDAEVPCGGVSESLIDANGLELHPSSLEGAVGDVLGKVVNGEADAGWVYRTDAAAAGEDVEIIDIPGAEDFPNTLWIATTTNAENPEGASAFVELALSSAFAEFLSAAGFTPASE